MQIEETIVMMIRRPLERITKQPMLSKEQKPHDKGFRKLEGGRWKAEIINLWTLVLPIRFPENEADHHSFVTKYVGVLASAGV